MNINRDYLLILDVKSGNLTVPTMYFINTDRGTSNIYLQLIVKNTDIKVSPLENATNYKVKANIVKSGGIIKFIEGVLVNEEDAIYEFNLPVDCINLSGAYRIEFEVSADVGEKQESITSFSTKYYVKRSILAEINEEIEDGDDYPLIVKLLAKIEELEKDSETRWIAENERIANEELRVQAESERLARYTLAEEKEAQRVIDEEARINAENERLAKEEERIAKEIDRVAKETERLNEEEIRKGSEITRVLNETTRVTNEEARVEAENIRLPKYLEAEEKEQARLSAEEQRIANENIRVANENDRISAESIRDSKEADRLNSEIFRLTNEVNRLENEKLRTNNEATRINSELTRVDNERNRVVAEKSRANSEDIRKTNENNRKIYEANREKAEQVRVSNESIREENEIKRQQGYTLMSQEINNLGTTLSQYALISYVDDRIANIQLSGGGSYVHPETHPATMITGLSDVAISGNYNDLNNKPTIPTKTSELSNDSGFTTKKYVDDNKFSGNYNDLTNKPTIPSEYHLPVANQTTLGGIKVGAGLSITADGILSATGGGTADSVEWTNILRKPTFTTVATSGNYNDLTNKPTIPTVTNDLTNGLKSNYDTAYIHSQSAHAPSNAEANVQADWNITDTSSDAYIKNKPNIPSTDGLASTIYVDNKVAGIVSSAPAALDTLNELAQALGNDPNFATTIATEIGTKVDKVDGKGLSTNDLSNALKGQYDTAYQHSQSAHFSGNYNDLTNKPTIPEAYSHPTSHPASMITGLATVATSGSYNNLSNKPTIPSKTSQLTNDSGYITSSNIPSSLPANGGNANTVGGYTIWIGTQAQYNAISNKSSTTIYFIKEG